MKEKESVMKIGVVDGFELISEGKQWTTISGVRYATTWELRNKDWRIGDEVAFDVIIAKLWAGRPKILQATNIRLARPASPAFSHPAQAPEPENPALRGADLNPFAVLGW